MRKNIQFLLLWCSMIHKIFCTDDNTQQHEAQASDSNIKRHYYVHHNQLRQQLLNITGPNYNAASMNLGELYNLINTNIDPNTRALVYSTTYGNVTLGSIVNSPTIGNLALATLIAQMQGYAYLTATSLNTFTIVDQNPSGLISTNGTTITFNTAGSYVLTGSFTGRILVGEAPIATLTLSDNCSNGDPVSFAIPGPLPSALVPVVFPYTALHDVQVGDTISFSKSSNWEIPVVVWATNITLNIIRIS